MGEVHFSFYGMFLLLGFLFRHFQFAPRVGNLLPVFRYTVRVANRVVSVSTVFCCRVAFLSVAFRNVVGMSADLDVIPFLGGCPNVYVRVDNITKVNFRHLVARFLDLVGFPAFCERVVNVIIRYAGVEEIMGRYEVMDAMYLHRRHFFVVGVTRSEVRVEWGFFLAVVYDVHRDFLAGDGCLVVALHLTVNGDRVRVRLGYLKNDLCAELASFGSLFGVVLLRDCFGRRRANDFVNEVGLGRALRCQGQDFLRIFYPGML